MARTQGHKIDEAAIKQEYDNLLSILTPARELLVENGDDIPDLPITGPYVLMTLAARGYPADLLTDAAVHNFANKQSSEGSWTVWAPWPPIEYGDIQTTALSPSFAIVCTERPPSRVRDEDTGSPQMAVKRKGRDVLRTELEDVGTLLE